MSQIELDACNRKSLYLQIRDQIIPLIDKGVLKAGNRLPATRELLSKLNNDFFPEEKAVCDRLTSEGIGLRLMCRVLSELHKEQNNG